MVWNIKYSIVTMSHLGKEMVGVQTRSRSTNRDIKCLTMPLDG